VPRLSVIMEFNPTVAISNCYGGYVVQAQVRCDCKDPAGGGIGDGFEFHFGYSSHLSWRTPPATGAVNNASVIPLISQQATASD